MRPCPHHCGTWCRVSHMCMRNYTRLNLKALHHHTPNEPAAGGDGCRRWSACRARGWMTPGQQLVTSEEQRTQRLADSSRNWTSRIRYQLLAMA